MTQRDTLSDSAAGAGPEREYMQYLAEGRFMIQRARATGEYVFYPRIAVPGTGDTDLEWTEACGRGRVYATTVVRRRPEQGGSYNVALIDLEEGPRLMSRVEDIEPDEVAIGMAVRSRIDTQDGEPLLVFVPA